MCKTDFYLYCKYLCLSNLVPTNQLTQLSICPEVIRCASIHLSTSIPIIHFLIIFCRHRSLQRGLATISQNFDSKSFHTSDTIAYTSPPFTFNRFMTFTCILYRRHTFIFSFSFRFFSVFFYLF